jgi:septum formation protein
MPTSIPLILASASPRRSELLRNAGIDFLVKPADIDERKMPTESPLDYARRMAGEKARAVHKQFATSVVLGADTVVVSDQVLGKPHDAREAARMLRMLSGRSHFVITGVCLTGPEGGSRIFEDVRSESTEVFMKQLTEKEIEQYIATGEPLDKAGGYGIQGRASRFVPKIVGCYFNVVGLPVALVTEMLRQHRLL